MIEIRLFMNNFVKFSVKKILICTRTIFYEKIGNFKLIYLDIVIILIWRNLNLYNLLEEICLTLLWLIPFVEYENLKISTFFSVLYAFFQK